MLESIYFRHHQQITFAMLHRFCQLSSFYLFLFYIYSIFYLSKYHFSNFLELYSTLNRKMIFVTNFPFLMDSLNPLHSPSPTTQQPKSSKHGKFFCQCSLDQFYCNRIRLFLQIQFSINFYTKRCLGFRWMQPSLDYLHFIEILFSCNGFLQCVSSSLEINHQV